MNMSVWNAIVPWFRSSILYWMTLLHYVSSSTTLTDRTPPILVPAVTWWTVIFVDLWRELGELVFLSEVSITIRKLIDIVVYDQEMNDERCMQIVKPSESLTRTSTLYEGVLTFMTRHKPRPEKMRTSTQTVMMTVAVAHTKTIPTISKFETTQPWNIIPTSKPMTTRKSRYEHWDRNGLWYHCRFPICVQADCFDRHFE